MKVLSVVAALLLTACGPPPTGRLGPTSARLNTYCFGGVTYVGSLRHVNTDYLTVQLDRNSKIIPCEEPVND